MHGDTFGVCLNLNRLNYIFTTSCTKESWLTSVVFLGMLLGAYFWGAVADAVGRRPTFAAVASVTLICGVASAFAPSYLVGSPVHHIS